MAKKLRLGFFSFTCCEGCMINVIEVFNEKFFEWKDKIDIAYFRALKKVKPISKMDVAFVEGAISTKSEINKLKKIRANATKVIALGSGAINGWPSNLRNDFKGIKKKEVEVLIERLGQIENVLPAKEVIDVDGEIPGCPADGKLFVKKMEELLNA
jgi:sulfhydrogenase subunit delta